MFDRAEIQVKAGDGGGGVISFRREKFVPYGGPDGGDGGNGGNIVIRANSTVDDLRKYRQKRAYRAKSGQNGGGSKKHGKNGEDLVLTVPPGTMVTIREESSDEALVADLEYEGDEVTVVKGGRGGWGNTHFASSTNQAPHIAQRGEAGEEKTVLLEMRLIADVGVIGYPNVGKSTLLAAATAARPKVDSYPFTTIEPVLGVVEVGQQTFIMAEIPGLIEGAHLGRGLGHQFLQHVLRTKILIHIISGSSELPVKDMLRVNEELALFDPALARKPQIIAINKIDLPEVQARLADIKRELAGAGIKAFGISAATGDGVSGLMNEAMKVLNTITGEQKAVEPTVKVFRPQPGDAGVKVKKVGKEFVLSVPELERIIVGAGINPAELRWQLSNQLDRLGVNRALEKAGVKPGDKIRCGELTWEW